MISKIDFIESYYILVYYTTGSHQSLLLTSKADLAIFLENVPQTARLVSKRNKTGKIKGKTLTLSIVGALAFILLAYFILIPTTAEYFAGKIPEKYDKAIGNKVLASMTKELKTDTTLTHSLQLFFDSLQFSDSSVHIIVVKSSEINAFALPGKNILVFDSILHLMNRPEECAALLAHEYAHIYYRHTLKALARNVSGRLFLLLVLRQAGNLMTTLADNADMVRSLQYSRRLEKEADEKGIGFLEKSGINPKGMLWLMESLSKKTSEGNFEFLSTHPEFKKRLSYIRAKISQDSVMRVKVKGNFYGWEPLVQLVKKR